MEKTPKKILIMEDNTDLRETLKAMFLSDEYDVRTASDGEEGLHVALTEKPDIILLDVLMPKKDGVTVLKELRADAWGKTARVIVLTALDDFEKISEILVAGGDEYIVKTDVAFTTIAQKVKEKLAV